MLTEKVVELTNIEREKAGLQPLKINNQLANTAQNHSNNMAEDDFFSHTGADGSSVSDRVEDSGYQYSTTGENIAAGQTSAEEVVEGWMDSPGHRANILNPDYTEIGVGYEQLQNDPGSVNYNHYWTQVFGNSSEDNSNNIKSSDSDSVDSIANSTDFTNEPKEDSMDSNNNSSSDNKFEIGDGSFPQSLFTDDDAKSSDLDSVDSIKDLANFTGTPNEDFMVSTDSSSERSFSISNSNKSEDSSLVDLIPDLASFNDMPNEDPMVSTDSSSERSFSISNSNKSEDSSLMDNEIENLVNFASDTFSENFCQMYI